MGLKALPDFLVVGAAKSGTTSLFHYLTSHPQIYVPEIKECRFFSQMPRNFKGGQAAAFANSGPRRMDDYVRLFEGKEELVKGDISNDYFFYYERSIQNIRDTLGTRVPIVIVLRNPIERIFSQYLHAVRLGSEINTFEKALELEDVRVRENYVWSMLYRRTGFSYAATRAYLDAFDNVRVFLFDDLVRDPGSICEEIFGMVGVMGRKLEVEGVFNAAQPRLPKSLWLNKIVGSPASPEMLRRMSGHLPSSAKTVVRAVLKWVKQHNRGAEARMEEATRQKLVNFYRDDITRLSTVLNRDLSQWLGQ